MAERRSFDCGGVALGFLGLSHIGKMTYPSSFCVTPASILFVAAHPRPLWHATGWPPGSVTPIFDPSFLTAALALSR
jgi:hypothetical protein